jgi:ectoine hydroxylase-related dioxygenase (phytanoyl-CoA dioxygenase family)
MDNIATGATTHTTAADLEAYRRDGAVCLRQVFAPEWIDLLNRGVDRNIANPGPWFTDFTDKAGGGRCIKDDFCWERIPEYEAFVRRSPAAAIAGELMQAREVCFIEDQYFQKEAGASTPTPYHQDQSYYEVRGEWCVAWIPLDPHAAEDSLRIVAGSHGWGKLFTPKSFAGEGGAFDVKQAQSPLEPVPDIEGDPARYRVLAWAMEPGDCLVFHPRALHGNSGNRSAHRARRLSLRWVSETATYDQGVLPWATFVPEHGLAHGERIIGRKFPLVWTRAAGLVAEQPVLAEQAADLKGMKHLP